MDVLIVFFKGKLWMSSNMLQAFNVKLCKGLLPAFSTGLGPVLPFARKSTVV